MSSLQAQYEAFWSGARGAKEKRIKAQPGKCTHKPGDCDWFVCPNCHKRRAVHLYTIIKDLSIIKVAECSNCDFYNEVKRVRGLEQ